MSNIYAEYCEELEKLDLVFVLPTEKETIIRTGISKDIMSANLSHGDLEVGVDNITGYMAKLKVDDGVKVGYNGGTDKSYGAFIEINKSTKDKNVCVVASTSGKTNLTYQEKDFKLSMGHSLSISGKNLGFEVGPDKIGFSFCYTS